MILSEHNFFNQIVKKGFSVVFLITLFCLCSYEVDAQTVYTTKTGTKYHRETCRYLKYSKYVVGLKEAKEKGYAPCKVCRPSTTVSDHQKTDSSSFYPQKQQPPIKYTTSRRCMATTKAGARCKRMTKNSNQRCWQHQ